MPHTFFLILAVQFVSTLADNALLIIAIARVMELNGPVWVIPVIKISFTAFYVLLGPVAGTLADAFPKGRVMLAANILKVCAVVSMMVGADPWLVMVVAGLGAAIYAPAKYGLITELLPPGDLVRANGFVETVTVCAVILGTAMGGLLISPVMPVWVLPGPLSGAQPTALLAGMVALVSMHLLATLLSIGVADSGARYAKHSIHPAELFQRFFRDNARLWMDQVGALSMAVTTLLWAVAATLQLIVLRWANEALKLGLDQAAYLQVVTAIGVIFGAVLASRYVRLEQVTKLLPVGVLIGILIPFMLAVKGVFGAVTLLIAVGVLAGFFVVPMNALLQYRGCQLLTAGRSIAVQGFNENAGMLLMLATYALGSALHASLAAMVWVLAGMMSIGMTVIYIVFKMSKKNNQSVAY
ncbi:lysophospholipid transporter LplT [Rhodoferax sp.]|uniref:lysophospholipid transporter LplT n=1 Tax=Rhodoferax sp. TaxID=50421 RepID=UPI00284C570B|nr:lysophospholipid transporter LplT [Rhodoferax sp.]MDR3369576.1 lysophospholipid transporter LplT [Rhodoferax sp.]